MVILGLGTNKGDRAAQLNRAVALLQPLLANFRRSSIYETCALLPKGAPADWDMPFLNMAVAGDTTLEPAELLAEIKSIERSIGRKEAAVWAPREIDIDILAMGAITMVASGLAIPHRELLNRDFALLPLAELAPDWCYPDGEYRGWKAADIVTAKGYRCGTLQETGIAAYG